MCERGRNDKFHLQEFQFDTEEKAGKTLVWIAVQ